MLNIKEAVIAVLKEGTQEGSALFEGVVRLYGTPLPKLWRETLIALTKEKVIEREVVRDDNDEVVEVLYELPCKSRSKSDGRRMPKNTA